MFKINIHNLKEGEHKYDFIASSSDFNFSSETVSLADDIIIQAVLYKVGHQISVRVSLKGKFKFECDRCLDDYIYDFNTAFDIIYRYQFGDSGSYESNDDDDIKFIPPNTVHIDLAEDIRDFILLSIPMKKAPEDIDGVCTYCRKNINERFNIKKQEEINPVWEKLIKAKN